MALALNNLQVSSSVDLSQRAIVLKNTPCITRLAELDLYTRTTHVTVFPHTAPVRCEEAPPIC